MSTLNVFMCVRNNETSLPKTLDSLHKLEQIYCAYDFYFYIFENDSTDKTKELVKVFFDSHNGNYSLQTFNKQMWNNVKERQRTEDMANYRNTMKNLCSTFEDSLYSIILDTDIEFDLSIFNKMITILEENSDIHMVTPYGVIKNKPLKYYDTFALDLKSSVSGSKLKKLKYESQQHKLINLNSGFAGFVMIRTRSLQKCSWKALPELVCSEHNGFCRDVLKYGQIVCAKDIKVYWTQ